MAGAGIRESPLDVAADHARAGDRGSIPVGCRARTRTSSRRLAGKSRTLWSGRRSPSWCARTRGTGRAACRTPIWRRWASGRMTRSRRRASNGAAALSGPGGLCPRQRDRIRRDCRQAAGKPAARHADRGKRPASGLRRGLDPRECEAGPGVAGTGVGAAGQDGLASGRSAGAAWRPVGQPGSARNAQGRHRAGGDRRGQGSSRTQPDDGGAEGPGSTQGPGGTQDGRRRRHGHDQSPVTARRAGKQSAMGQHRRAHHGVRVRGGT